ncbi:integrase [Deltaproteobacteria bacterium Smac51]|nr:integrase [Deltaproteobacteria bacterium Smac51]
MDTALNSTSPALDNEIIRDEEFTTLGYQVVRREFFAHIKEPSVTFNKCQLSINTACLNKLPAVDYVQLLVNPEEMKLAILPSEENVKDSFLWCVISKQNGRKKPRPITCRVLLAKLTRLMGWNPAHRLKIMGKLVESNGEHLFIFDLRATEVYQNIGRDGEKLSSSRIPLFPAEWLNQFGLPVEEHRKTLQVKFFDEYAVFGLKDPPEDSKCGR